MAEERSKKIGRGLVRTANSIVNLVVLTGIIIMVAIGVYAIWDSDQIFKEADSEQFEIYKPSSEDTVTFEELREVNPEVFSWLTIYGTHIDYPVAQGEDNIKYVNTNAYGEYSLSGSIFLDYTNDKSFSDYNSIMYGHHMQKQAMFGELGNFSEKSYFDERRYGNIFYDGRDHGLEFFAFIQTDAYDNEVFKPGVMGGEQQHEYLAQLLEKACYTRDIGVTVNDNLLLMSTCSSDVTNGRSVLIGRITDEVFADTFALQTDDIQEADMVDELQGFFCKCHICLWLHLLLLLLTILFVVLYTRHREKKWRRDLDGYIEDMDRPDTDGDRQGADTDRLGADSHRQD